MCVHTVTEATVKMTRHGEVLRTFSAEDPSKFATRGEALDFARKLADEVLGGDHIFLERGDQVVFYRPAGNPIKPRLIVRVVSERKS